MPGIRLALFIIGSATAISLVNASSVIAQEKSDVVGQVREKGSERSLEAVEVRIPSYDLVVYSDRDGRFRIRNVPVGEVEVVVRSLGYSDLRTTIEVAAATPVLLELEPAPLRLAAINVAADRLDTRRRSSPHSVRFLSGEDLLRPHPRATVADVLSQRLLRIEKCPSDPATTLRCVNYRGQPTLPQVYIDEARVHDGLLELRGLPPQAVHTVEVYQGGRHIRIYTKSFMESIASVPTYRFLPITQW